MSCNMSAGYISATTTYASVTSAGATSAGATSAYNVSENAFSAYVTSDDGNYPFHMSTDMMYDVTEFAVVTILRHLLV